MRNFALKARKLYSIVSVKPKYKWILGAKENAFLNHIKQPKLHFYLFFAVIQDIKLKLYALVLQVTKRQGREKIILN